MSSRAAVRFTLFASVTLFLLVFTTSLYADGCSLVGSAINCSGLDFSTSGQSMFGTGQGQAIYNNTFGTSWNVGGQVGGIYNARFLGIDLGSYGAELRASTSGNIGLSVDFRANGGTVNANVNNVGIGLGLPDLSQTYKPGQLLTVTSTFDQPSINNSSFTTQSPTIAGSAQLSFGMAANIGATVCVVACGGFNLGFNTGQQTIPIFSYNEALHGTGVGNISVNNSGLKIFGMPVNSGTFSGDVPVPGLAPGTWTASVDVSPAATTVQTASTISGNKIVASGVADNPVLSTTFDAAKLLTNVDGIALSSGSPADLLPSGTPSIVKDIAGLVGWNLVTADVGAGLKLGQNFTMQQAGGAEITLALSAGGKSYGSVSFQAGESAQFAMPVLDCSSGTCPTLTLTPTIALNPVGFSSSVTLTPELELQLQALGLSFAGFNLGPLVNWNQDIPLGSFSLFSANTQLGFASLTESSAAFALNETQGLGGTQVITNNNGVETVSYSYRNIPTTGLALGTGNSVVEEHLVGSLMQPDSASGASRASVTMGPGATLSLDQSSAITNIDISATGSQILALQGTNTIQNSTVHGNSALLLNVGNSSEAGNLVLKDSALDSLRDVEVTGSLTLDHTTLSITGTGLGTGSYVDGLLLENGSVADFTGSEFGLYTWYGSATITSNSTLSVGWLHNAYAIVTVDNGSTLNVEKLERGELDINQGGTANVTYLFSPDTLNVNAGGTLNLVGSGSIDMNMSNPIHLNGGLITVSGTASMEAQFNGTGELRVLAGAELDMVPSYWFGNRDSYFNQGSQLNIEGTLKDDGQLIHASQAVANVSGSLILFDQASLEIGTMNIAQSGQFVISQGTADAAQITNAGLVGIDSASSLTVSGNYVQAGSVQNATIVNGVSAPGTSSTVVNGTLSAASLTFYGGTLSGNGTINGNVTVGATIPGASVPALTVVQPGDAPGTLTINGSYTQMANALLAIQFGSPTDFSRLLVNGDVSLDGTLLLDMSSDFLSQLAPGESFEFLSLNGTLSGAFSQVQFDYQGNTPLMGYVWDLIYGTNGVDLVWNSTTDYGPLAVAIQNGTAIPTNFTTLDQGLSPEIESIIAKNHSGIDFSKLTFGSNGYVAPTYYGNITKSPEPTSLLLVVSGLLAGARWLKKFAK